MTEELKKRLQQVDSTSPQEAVGMAIRDMSSKEKVKMLSWIRSEKEAFRYGLMFDVGEALRVPLSERPHWLESTATTILQLLVSIKGRGRADNVKMVSQSDAMGFGQRAIKKVRDFLGGGGGQ